MGYTLQDVQCIKCGEVKLSNMGRRCTCAGNYQTLISNKDVRQLLKTFNGISKHYRMPLLKEITGFYLEERPFVGLSK
jgi:DNA polymerase epsilon subunit 1